MRTGGTFELALVETGARFLEILASDVRTPLGLFQLFQRVAIRVLGLLELALSRVLRVDQRALGIRRFAQESLHLSVLLGHALNLLLAHRLPLILLTELSYRLDCIVIPNQQAMGGTRNAIWIDLV